MKHIHTYLHLYEISCKHVYEIGRTQIYIFFKNDTKIPKDIEIFKFFFQYLRIHKDILKRYN